MELLTAYRAVMFMLLIKLQKGTLYETKAAHTRANTRYRTIRYQDIIP